MGHVYPQEGESEREMAKSPQAGRGDSRLKGHSVYGEKERLRDIDVRREERDEERQLGMERAASGSEKRKG